MSANLRLSNTMVDRSGRVPVLPVGTVLYICPVDGGHGLLEHLPQICQKVPDGGVVIRRVHIQSLLDQVQGYGILDISKQPSGVMVPVHVLDL